MSENAIYPSGGTLNRIAHFAGSARHWLDICEDAWNLDYGVIRVKPGERHFITGGWSGNESIIDAMAENVGLFGQVWLSSHRGGLHVFSEPKSETVA